ncbi:MAG TPA: SAF domain-containing protein [Candidatus Binatia bacterium]|jgi:Flp pilus assembly protein CpaB|nr:SAF domain-containing protein [Candidatus Binatia bacterium]
MGRRTIAILLLVGSLLLLLVVAAFFLLQGGNQPSVPQNTPVAEEGVTPGVEEAAGEEVVQETPSAATLIEVVVSLQTVPRGWQLTEAELTTDMRRAELVGDNVITNIEDVMGKYARTEIFQGQTLTKDAVVGDPRLAGVEDYGPSSLIPSGFVAQAVPLNRLSSVGYGLAAGDYVDVMVNFYVSEIDPEFQTLLQNSAAFILEGEANAETGETQQTIFMLDPFGRFENLANGDLALLSPSERQRPTRVAMLIQAAKVIQVGRWTEVEGPVVPTATPTPNPEATPTPEVGVVPTATPPPADVVLLALSPQQQLLLKYAVESGADIDYALRSVDNTEIFGVDNVDINYLLQRFNIEVPVDFDFTVEPVLVTVTPTPAAEEGGEGQ